MLYRFRSHSIDRSRRAGPARGASTPAVERLERRDVAATFDGTASVAFADPRPEGRGRAAAAHVSWAETAPDVAGSGPSELDFATARVGAEPSVPFSLGTLAFVNRPNLAGTAIDSVDLSVTVELASPSGFSGRATFPLHLTIGTTTNVPGDATGSQDSVTMDEPSAVTIAAPDGSRAQLSILGFGLAGGAGGTSRTIRAGEGQRVSVELRAEFQAIIAPVRAIRVAAARVDTYSTVSFGYEAEGNPGDVAFRLYESADVAFDPSDVALGDPLPLTPAPDASGAGSIALPWKELDPARPYLLLVPTPAAGDAVVATPAVVAGYPTLAQRIIASARELRRTVPEHYRYNYDWDGPGGLRAPSIKCNLFAYDALTRAGLPVPIRRRGYFFHRYTSPLLANEWAKEAVPGFTRIAGGAPRAGDVIIKLGRLGGAENGHMGIVSGPGLTISAATPGYGNGLVENDFGFRPQDRYVIQRPNSPS